MKLYLITYAFTQDDHIPMLITDSRERAERICKQRYVYYTEFDLNKEIEQKWGINLEPMIYYDMDGNQVDSRMKNENKD